MTLKDGTYYHSYSRKISIPKEVRARLPRGKFLPNYTEHAIKEAQREKYGVIELPTVLDYDAMRPTRVDVVRGKIDRVNYRQQYNGEFDVTYVVSPTNHSIITVWLNLYHDHHESLKLPTQFAGG